MTYMNIECVAMSPVSWASWGKVYVGFDDDIWEGDDAKDTVFSIRSSPMTVLLLKWGNTNGSV